MEETKLTSVYVLKEIHDKYGEYWEDVKYGEYWEDVIGVFSNKRSAYNRRESFMEEHPKGTTRLEIREYELSN